MAVAWNVDGTYISHHMAIPTILFDLERIELVRGPLGTLYGKNSNGGAINVLTARPVLGEWDASGRVGYGNYDQVDTQFMVNIPLGEQAALRLSAANDYSDGYYEDGGYGTDNYAFRARLLFEPSDNFDLISTFEWSDSDGSGPSLGYCPPTAYADYPACVGIDWKPYQGLGLPGNFELYGTDGPIGESPNWSQRENVSAYVEWNYSWDAATLTSITNYHKYDRAEFHVWDFFTYRPVHQNTYVTQELRLASNADSSFDWVIGAFLADEQSTGRENFGSINEALTEQVVNNYYGVDDGQVVTRALFGDVTIPIGDRLRLNGGLRWTYERKDLPGSAATNLSPGAGTPVFVDTGSTLEEDGKITWSAGAQFDLTDNSMIYFKVNTGFKSGTVNQIPTTVTAVRPTTDPEEVTAYQIGSKNLFMDGRLSLNAEFFYYDYEGYQVVVATPDPTGFFPGVFFPSVNAQKAELKGGEIEASFVPWENGQLNLAVALLDATHTEFVTTAFDWSGHDMLGSPDTTIIASYQHDWDLSGGGVLSGRVNTQWVDGYFTHDNNVAGSWQDSYTRTDLSLSYTFPENRWSIRGWVRNLEDEAVVNVSQFSCCRGGWAVFMKPPRMYGVSVNYQM
jgi:iron complex outermembrane receptor protein